MEKGTAAGNRQMLNKPSDSDFLNWIADRLVFVYGESPNVDFVQRLRKIAGKITTERKTIIEVKDRLDSIIELVEFEAAKSKKRTIEILNELEYLER